MISDPQWKIGYCTNIHAGTDMKSIRENLSTYAVAARLSTERDTLGVGLWLPASAAKELVHDVEPFRKFLAQLGLTPYTINGFPYDNFHEPVVKHQVYSPPWWEPSRLQYTQQLATILANLLPEESPLGSISTLPIGWPPHEDQATNLSSDSSPKEPQGISKFVETAGEQLRILANFLAQLHADTGRKIVVAIEPEPGCLLDTVDDVIDFFDAQLTEPDHRQFITVCHDVCHSAVMMESQRDVFNRLADAEISVGKVQISNAIIGDWQSMAVGRRQEAIEQLRQFAEDRYLHQTSRRTQDGSLVLTEDLPQLLRKVASEGDPVWGDLRWTVHFHVPIFLERFGHLMTSQEDIFECLKALHDPTCQVQFSGHLEVETYAWNVMPESMRKHGLADDIAAEIRWLSQAILQTRTAE